jgi:hypothetical protein
MDMSFFFSFNVDMPMTRTRKRTRRWRVLTANKTWKEGAAGRAACARGEEGGSGRGHNEHRCAGAAPENRFLCLQLEADVTRSVGGFLFNESE